MKEYFQVWKTDKKGESTLQELEIKKGQKVTEFASVDQIKTLLKDKPGMYEIRNVLLIEKQAKK